MADYGDGLKSAQTKGKKLRAAFHAKLKILLIIVGVLLGGTFFVKIQAILKYNEIVERGNVLVERILQYQDRYGTVPWSFNQIGLEESETGPYYYQRMSDEEFYIWAQGFSIGESVLYRSKNRTWKREG